MTPGSWYVRAPYGHCKRPVVGAPGCRSVCTVNKIEDARLISASKEMLFITKLVAELPITNESARDDIPLFGVNGKYITVGDVRAARAALQKIGEGI